MAEPKPDKSGTSRETFSHHIEKKVGRKRRARRIREKPLWVGLGTMGMVGWSVGIPTLLGALIGVWIDKTWPGAVSWTLTLLVGGLFIGVFGAWHWVTQQMKEISQERQETRDE